MSSMNTVTRGGPMPVIIPQAQLVSYHLHQVPFNLAVAEVSFHVPLDYRYPYGEKLRLFGRIAFRYERPASGGPAFSWSLQSEAAAANAAGAAASKTQTAADEGNNFRSFFSKPWMAYLEGGPGGGNREPQDYPFTRIILERGYHMLYLDYRGTGLSSTVTAHTLKLRGQTAAEQAQYLRLFRADNIVRDLEAVRKYLTADQPPGRRNWSVLGQSYGGFVALTYLSFHPDGLREVFMSGGLGPVGRPPDEVYRSTYRKARERNAAYFAKFPEDVETLHIVATFLARQPSLGSSIGPAVRLPGGGALTMQRVLTLGYAFGFHGGLDTTHALLLRMRLDITNFGFFTRPTLMAVEEHIPLDFMPLYALVHEALYCYTRGIASRWSASRVAAEFSEFRWVTDPATISFPLGSQGPPPVFFSGEMIYPFMFDTYPELRDLKEVASIYAEYDDWEDLYDEEQLAANRVPVYAASFVHDLYVDFDLARETARKVRNIKVFETNTLYHNALRVRTDEVMTQLFRLRDDTLD